jgi:magnesium transporter
MLRAYGPDCDGSVIDPAKGQRIPDEATWIDLEEPTREEDKIVEQCVGVRVPTREDMVEIEPSSRLYEENGTLYMTLSALHGVDDGHPRSDPISFVLTADRLVTVRYVTPKPIRVLELHARRDKALVADNLTALHSLLDAIIDRLADELEAVGGEVEKISTLIFHKQADARRIPADRLTALLTKIGRTQMLLAKVRETAVSTARLLSFLSGTGRLKAPDTEVVRDRILSLARDVSARRFARLDQHRAECGDEALFLGGAGLPAADIGRRHLRHELRAYAGARLALRLSDGVGLDLRHCGRAHLVPEAPRLDLSRVCGALGGLLRAARGPSAADP